MAEKHPDTQYDEDVEQKNGVLHAEVLKEPELMSDAYHAEEREHQQGLWVSNCGGQRQSFWHPN